MFFVKPEHIHSLILHNLFDTKLQNNGPSIILQLRQNKKTFPFNFFKFCQ